MRGGLRNWQILQTNMNKLHELWMKVGEGGEKPEKYCKRHLWTAHKGRWVAAAASLHFVPYIIPAFSAIISGLWRWSCRSSLGIGRRAAAAEAAVIRERAIADQAENIPRIQVKGGITPIIYLQGIVIKDALNVRNQKALTYQKVMNYER